MVIFLGINKSYLPLLCNAPLELNAFSEDLVKLISPLAYGLVVAQIDVTKTRNTISVYIEYIL